MNELMDALLEELQKQHGGKTNIKEESYYLYLEDGHFFYSFDEDEKTVKVDIQFSEPGTEKVYHSKLRLDDLLEGAE